MDLMHVYHTFFKFHNFFSQPLHRDFNDPQVVFCQILEEILFAFDELVGFKSARRLQRLIDLN